MSTSSGAEFVAPTIQETKQEIKRRYKISSWFGRAMFALGVGSGLALAHGGAHNNQAESNAALSVMLGSAVSGGAEKVFAKRSILKTETNFQYMNSYGNGNFVTRVEVQGDSFESKKHFDYRSAHNFEWGSPLINGSGDMLAGVGTLFIAGTKWAEQSQIADPSKMVNIGAGMLALGSVSLILGQLLDKAAVDASLCRVDNMASGLYMTIPTDNTETT